MSKQAGSQLQSQPSRSKGSVLAKGKKAGRELKRRSKQAKDLAEAQFHHRVIQNKKRSYGCRCAEPPEPNPDISTIWEEDEEDYDTDPWDDSEDE